MTNKLRALIIGTALVVSALFAVPVMAVTEHCPAGGVKTEARADELNDVVLSAGTSFCVKGSTDATGILIADGETTLVDYLDNGHDVSYYVVYATASPSPTPSPSPSPSPTPSSSPTPTPTPEPTPSPTPEASPTPTPSEAPTPTEEPTPGLTLPPTDTAAQSSQDTSGRAILLPFFVIAALAAAIYMIDRLGNRPYRNK